MFNPKFLLVLLLAISFALNVCGSGDEEASTSAGSAEPNAASGQAIFEETIIGSTGAIGCVTCHAVDEGVQLVGPSLAGIATKAEQIVNDSAYTGEAKTARQYLVEAIVKPDVFINQGFVEGSMYQFYGEQLSSEQVNDLVAYLETLK